MLDVEGCCEGGMRRRRRRRQWVEEEEIVGGGYTASNYSGDWRRWGSISSLGRISLSRFLSEAGDGD